VSDVSDCRFAALAKIVIVGSNLKPVIGRQKDVEAAAKLDDPAVVGTERTIVEGSFELNLQFYTVLRKTVRDNVKLLEGLGFLVVMFVGGDEGDRIYCADLHADFTETEEVQNLVFGANERILKNDLLCSL
jgi:hypothetical protein